MLNVLMSTSASRLGRVRICIVPESVPLARPDIFSVSVDANEFTCLACFAARVIALPADSVPPVGWPALPAPQPAASRAAAAAAAMVTVTFLRGNIIGPFFLGG